MDSFIAGLPKDTQGFLKFCVSETKMVQSAGGRHVQWTVYDKNHLAPLVKLFKMISNGGASVKVVRDVDDDFVLYTVSFDWDGVLDVSMF